MIIFNGFCLLAISSHIRATFADPGEIPNDIEVPDYVDTVKLRNCEKCDMRWKPMRAHHCSECNKCIFKVSISIFNHLSSFFPRWIIIAHGSIIV
jgi:hypothetical protein